MDLDGDRRMDILSGSFVPGELYWFKKLEDGTYAKGAILKDANGKSIVVGSASTPFAADWDCDGKLDMLVGDISGSVWFLRGTGKLAFAAPARMQAAGKDIKAGDDSQPVVADWNKDGLWDLVLAHGDGTVAWYRNVGACEAPKLAEPEVLIAKSADEDGKPGIRAKVCVADVNGDGKPDIWLGDFGFAMKPPAGLTKGQVAEKEKLETRQKEIMEKMQPIREKAAKAANEAVGRKEFKDLTEDEKKTYTETLSKTMNDDPEYKNAMSELREVSKALSKYRGSPEYRGNVWLFTAKAESKPADAAPAGETRPEARPASE